MGAGTGPHRLGPGHGLRAVAELARRHHRRHLRRVVALVGRRPRRVLVGARRVVRRPLARPADRAPWRSTADARRAVVPRRPAELRRARCCTRRAGVDKDDGRGRGRRPRGRRARPSSRWRELRTQVGRRPRRAGRARRRRGRPRRRRCVPNCRRGAGRHARAARSARSGRRCSPDFGPRRSPTGSPRSSRSCCSPSTATTTAASSSTSAATVEALRGELPSLRATVLVAVPRRRRDAAGRHAVDRAARGTRGDAGVRADGVRRTRCGSCTPPARPGCRSRSCTATAASCSSTPSSSRCTSTSGPGDRFFWFSTTGWMMWNLLVSGLVGRLDDRAVRRQPGLPRPPTRCGGWRPSVGITCFGARRRTSRPA